MNKTILIVIPAYNEASRIGGVVAGIPATMTIGTRGFRTKVIVVDDDSRDATSAEAEKAGATVMRHVINSGAGAATRTGLRYAEANEGSFEYIVAIDADGQHAVSDIKKLIKHALDTDADMIVGNRLHKGNKEDIPFHRSFGNWGLSLISRTLFGIKVKDTQTGFRVFKPSAIPIVANYTIDRYGFCTEMLWLATKKNLKIREVPISVKYSDETLAKGQSNWGVFDLILSLLWVRISR